MRVDVLYFGILKEVCAAERVTVDLTERETVGGLLRLLQESASNPSEMWKVLAVAVNREYAGRETILREGDEVALLPPVSGGRGGVPA